MKKYPKISVIIPLYKKTTYFLETVEKCLELEYPDFEILVGVDGKADLKFEDKRIRILKTGSLRTGPAEKRDICIIKATGELIAFLDDDSYPDPKWLESGLNIINSQKVSSVCGPGLTPPADSFFQKLTGAVLASPFGSGPYYYRFTKGSGRFVDDYPAYNLIVRRDVLLKLGGFGTKFYGGEDTALLIKLINAGERVYYHPDIVVYHHRRKFPFEYARQLGNVGLHRGYFVKTYPKTSLRPSYFGPTALTVFLPLLFIWSLVNKEVIIMSFVISLLVWAAIFLESLRKNNLFISLLLPLAILVNHLVYGFQFLRGLIFIRRLER